ncbi:hypothetical protein DPMN_040250 [Dreissena polymorpha]|uniref:Uncharacterized protein n=2 Tax=Dreissena polymorpha TaxID=45954 RepID=A0A9D4CVM9_DREPO|nr:hypothetical protein DPMN_040250 [Dreissena polymorpha]
MYKVAALLRDESETVDLQIRLVSQHLLTKIKRKTFVEIHGRLHQARTIMKRKNCRQQTYGGPSVTSTPWDHQLRCTYV